jgi:DNA-binding IclR family transcriptional regulator
LATLGYLDHAPELQKYALSVGTLSLARSYLHSHKIISIARPLMREFSLATQTSVLLGAPGVTHMVLLESCQAGCDSRVELELEPGSRVPHGLTALGRAHLARLPRSIFDQHVDVLGKDSPADWARVKSGILQAREDYEQFGFCFSIGEWNPEVFAVGVPIEPTGDGPPLSINCSGHVSKASRERVLDELGPRLVALRNKVLALRRFNSSITPHPSSI